MVLNSAIFLFAFPPDLVIVMHNQVSMLRIKQFDSQAWVDVAATVELLKGATEGDG